MTTRYLDIPSHRQMQAIQREALKLFTVGSEWYSRAGDDSKVVVKADMNGIELKSLATVWHASEPEKGYQPSEDITLYRLWEALNGALMTSEERLAIPKAERDADTIDYLNCNVTD